MTMEYGEYNEYGEYLPEYTDKKYNIRYIPCQLIYTTLFWDLCKKYNLPSIIPEKKYNYINSPHDLYIKWYVNMYNMREIDVPKYYKYKVDKFMKNSNQRFMAFPLLMYNPHSIYNPMNTSAIKEMYSHMTVLIYDKQYGYLERFDSTNSLYVYDGVIVDTIITNVFQNLFNIKITGINTPWMICDNNGIQTLQEMEIYKSYYKPILGENIGFCTMYTLWYLEKRLQYANDTPYNIVNSEINKAIKLEKGSYPLTRMIKRYTYNKLKECDIKYNVFNMNLNVLINILNKKELSNVGVKKRTQKRVQNQI